MTHSERDDGGVDAGSWHGAMGFFHPSPTVGQPLKLEDHGGCQYRNQEHDYASNAQADHELYAFKNHLLAPNLNYCDPSHRILTMALLAIAPKRVTKVASGNLIHSRL